MTWVPIGQGFSSTPGWIIAGYNHSGMECIITTTKPPSKWAPLRCYMVEDVEYMLSMMSKVKDQRPKFNILIGWNMDKVDHKCQDIKISIRMFMSKIKDGSTYRHDKLNIWKSWNMYKIDQKCQKIKIWTQNQSLSSWRNIMKLVTFLHILMYIK